MARLSNDFKAILDMIPDDRKAIANKLITELTWMQKTLARLKKEVDSNGVIDKYLNGSAKDSVALKGYNTMVQRYGNLYKQLSDMMTIQKPLESDELVAFIK